MFMLTKSFIAFFLCFALVSCKKSIDFETEEKASLTTLSWLNKSYEIIENKEAEKILASITNRLANTLKHRTIKSSIINNGISRWNIYLIKSDEVNAFSLGAGRIVLTTNLLKQLNAEAELAAILAHEMSHQILAHNLAALEIAKENNTASFFSEEQELQADTLGVKIMYIAEYNIDYCTYPLQLYHLNLDHSLDKTNPVSNAFQKKRLININAIIKSINSPYSSVGTGNTREFQKLKFFLKD